jgi:integrase
MSTKRGPRTIHKLYPAKVTKSGKGKFCDGGGLWLVKDSRNTGRWSYRYQFENKSHELGLGSIHTITLTEAREKAKQLRKLQDEDIDPLTERRAARAQKKIEAAQAVTFRDYAAEYIERNRRKWSSPKHAAQWVQSLVAYVYPLIGNLSVAAIDTEAVKQVLQQHIDGVSFWSAYPETASRVRGRIEKVLDAAKISGKRDGENPARWRGHLQHLFPARGEVEKGKKKHFAAMRYCEVPSFMEALRRQHGIAARALEFTVLTAARVGEVLAMTWEETDGGVWTIPAHKMKTKEEHRVPLSKRAIEILEIVKSDSHGPYVFPGRGGKLAGKTLREVLASIRPGYTVHGFRSSFRDWAAEATEFPREVAEMALAHAVGDETERAYRRTKLFDRRRSLMADWAAFCGGKTGTVMEFARVS